MEVSNYSAHYHRNSTIIVIDGSWIEIKMDLLHPDLSGM